MTITQFIEKAIDGGWKVRGTFYDDYPDPIKEQKEFALTDYDAPTIEQIVLNPLAWQAVGKVEGWDRTTFKIPPEATILLSTQRPMWHLLMLWMIDALCEGRKIEQFLGTL